MPKPELPWTLLAWERGVMGNGHLDIPPWTAKAVALEFPPPTAIYWQDAGETPRWRTLADIASPSAQARIKHYAEQHGHVVPQEVLDAWVSRAETDRLIERVVQEAKRIATPAAATMRTEAELLRWVGNRLGDLAWELGQA